MAINKKGSVNFIVSPDKLDILFLQKKGGICKVLEKKEYTGSVVTNDSVNVDFIKKIITQLNIKNTEVGISLNIPFFFTNVIKVPNVEGNIKATLGMKIQTEFPLPLEKYLWSFQEIPSADSQRTFLVFFYHRSFLEDINRAFAINGILPVVIEPAILSALRYLKEKFTLEVEKTYFMIIIYASVLTGFIYENGIIKNTFSETISEEANVNQALEKFIQFTLQKFSVERIKREIGGVILVSDKKIQLGLDFEVIHMQDILKISPDSIIGIGLNERVLKAPVFGNEILLNKINPTTEFLYLKLLRQLNFWSMLVFGAGILSILSLYAFIFDISTTNKDLKNSSAITQIDTIKYEDEFKKSLLLLKKIDISKNIPYDVFSKVVGINRFMKINNFAIKNKNLTINGVINLKDQERLKSALAEIGKNAEFKEVRVTASEMEVEVSLDF